MRYLFQNGGKACAAKSVFMIAFATCIFKILFAGVTIAGVTLSDPNYAGMSMFISPLAALYWGRALTKAVK